MQAFLKMYMAGPEILFYGFILQIEPPMEPQVSPLWTNQLTMMPITM
jgi:hypothetical protein